MNRVCLGCKKEKETTEFNYKNKEKQIFQSQCKVCTRQQVKKHYYSKREYYLKKAQIRNKKIREDIREYVWGYLRTHPCVDCGEQDIVVLTFDHRQNKVANVSQMLKWRFGLNSVKQEILKCDVRCANCHLRKTAKDFGWQKYGPVAQLD